MLNIDVNLRGRIVEGDVDRYKRVGLLIGMCSVSKAAKSFKFATETVF